MHFIKSNLSNINLLVKQSFSCHLFLGIEKLDKDYPSRMKPHDEEYVKVSFSRLPTCPLSLKAHCPNPASLSGYIMGLYKISLSCYGDGLEIGLPTSYLQYSNWQVLRVSYPIVGWSLLLSEVHCPTYYLVWTNSSRFLQGNEMSHIRPDFGYNANCQMQFI